MIEIYIPRPAEGFELCYPVRKSDFETLRLEINGSPRGSSWISPPMRLERDEDGVCLEESDSPWLGAHALIFRKDSIPRIESFLLAYGELLPLACLDAELFVYNVTNVVDVLDEDASQVVRFSAGGLMRVKRYAFRAAAVDGIHVFKIPDFRSSPTYVSGEFVERFFGAGLRGLVFNRVWSG